MTAVARLTVVYGRDADAYSVARDADRALEGSGCHVSVADAEAVWISRRNGAATEATRFGPGQQLVVSYDDGWWIENVPAVTS